MPREGEGEEGATAAGRASSPLRLHRNSRLGLPNFMQFWWSSMKGHVRFV